jgi:hypothetical protein
VINSEVVCLDDSGGHFLHLRDDIPVKIIVFGRIGVVQVALELSIGELIGWFILLIILRVPLNGVIGEMDEYVVQIFKVKQFAASSNVPLSVPVSLNYSVDARHHNVVSDVELPI